jgi:hypothetical protein
LYCGEYFRMWLFLANFDAMMFVAAFALAVLAVPLG